MFEHLDGMEQLKVRRRGDGSGRRHINGGCNDAVTDLLAKCQSASALAQLAHRFGIGAEEIHAKADRASSFGQFRMVLGNRIRGIVRRLDRARRRGKPLSLQEAARSRRRRQPSVPASACM